MIDISNKKKNLRIAEASCSVLLNQEIIEKIKKNEIPKGDVLQTARIAGIQSAKDTFRIIPLCHPVSISFIKINFELKENEVLISSLVKGIDRTGVEMEALTAVAVAALTVYDMCKQLIPEILIKEIRLVKKEKLDINNER